MSRLITKKYTAFDERDVNLDETVFHNANGYIGIRGALEEGVPKKWNTMRGSYINGFYDVIPMKQAENLCNFVDRKDTMVNVSDTMTIVPVIEGEPLNLSKGRLNEHVRTLDMDCGYTKRVVRWVSKKRNEVEITSKRMTSFDLLSLFTIEYTLKAVNHDMDIELRSSHIAGVTNYCNPNDPRLASESIKNLYIDDLYSEGDVSLAVSRTSVSDLRVCSAVKNVISSSNVSFKRETVSGKEKIEDRFILRLLKGESVTLVKYCIYTDSIRNEDVEKKALADMEYATSKGVEYFYEKQSDFLSHFWKCSGMTICGDEALNKSVSYNMYELLQSAAKDPYCSIAAKGLSGEGYEGHYFWDTEVFVLPFFILTNPELAKMILNFRYNTLDKARENARLLGHKSGALFPWRTITGRECSGYFVSGSAAYHINADIAYAVVSYYLATGDLEFMRESGEEILIETARLWLDLGFYRGDGKFVLNDVTGPDEYTCMVNNNYYTNCAAKYNLEWAVKLYEKLEEAGMADSVKEKLSITQSELSAMSKAAGKMLLLYDSKLGINPQDDSFLNKPVWDFEHTPKENYPLLLHYHPLHLYRYQVCKQADTVMAYFMFEEMQYYDVMLRSYEYYEKITTHDSSLSTCAFSIVASRLGLRKKGFEYFGDSAKLDLENTHNNTKDGMHTANMGGCYMAIVNGFAGLRINENGLFLAPFLPEKWEGYKFSFMYKGRLIYITVNQFVMTAELIEGEAIEVNVYDGKYSLVVNEPIVVALSKDMAAVEFMK